MKLYLFKFYKMRKFRVLKIFALIVFITSVVFAGVTLQYFTAKTQGEGILIEWKTADEGGAVSFEIERSAQNPNNFIYITTINAAGNNSYYSYQDNTVESSSPTSNSIYYYRLKCNYSGGSPTYTNYISVVHTLSGIKSTWGSIKAIFR